MKATGVDSDPFSGRLSEWDLLARDKGRCEEKLARLRVSEERKRIAASNPIAFGRIYFPRWFKGGETPDFHWELVQGYMKFDRFAVGAPVGSAKTTILTKCCSLWSVFFENLGGAPVNEVLIVSNAQSIAGSFLDDMGAGCKASDELREDFGDFCGQHWGNDCLEFMLPAGKGTRRAVIRTVGKGGALRGRRPDRIIVDDPEDEESVKSEKQREDFRTWFWGALVNRLMKNKRLTYIGTCITDQTFLVELLNHPPAGWQVRVYAMLDEQRKASLWEAIWPVEYLTRRREEIGEAAFAAEFQNAPVSNWNQLLFDVTKIKIETHAIDGEDWVSVTVDPSYRVDGDAWALTLVAVDRKGQWHLKVARKDRTGTEGWLAALEETRTRHPRIHVLGIETGGGQVATEYIVSDWMRQRGLGFPAVRYLTHSHTGPAKTSRIANLTNIINTGRLSMEPGMAVAFSDIKSYRAGLAKQDDHVLDSLAMHLEVQHARTPSEKPEETPEEMRRRRFEALRKRISAGRAGTGRGSRYL